MDLSKAKYKVSLLFDKYWNEATVEVENKELLKDLEYSILLIIEQIFIDERD